MSSSLLEDRIREADKNNETILTIVLAERFLEESPSGTFWVFCVYASSLIGVGRYEDASSSLDKAEEIASTDRQFAWVLSRRGRLKAAGEIWSRQETIGWRRTSFSPVRPRI